MKLRKHQQEMVNLCKLILNGHPINEILAAVTPGGGKSALPVLLGKYLIPKIANKILWIVPRNSLKYQGEEEFTSSFWNTHIRLRAVNGNKYGLSNGYDGYLTTYQAIGQDPGPHWEEILKHKYIVFYDEIHHVSDNATWERSLEPIVNNSVLNVFGSGTLSRGDGKMISFMQYEGNYISTQNTKNRKVIKYGRSMALKDNAILPVHFKTIDGYAEWQETDGEKNNAVLSKAKENSAKALYTALRTEYAYKLLKASTEDWIEYRKHKYHNSKLLIVAHDIEQAEKYKHYMLKHFPNQIGGIATSKETTNARRAIRDYKKGFLSYLITVGMAYEGLSVPEITHIACLTNIRSIPWLEQLFARGNRKAPGKQCAYIYAPKDKNFIQAIETIENEQLIALKESVLKCSETCEDATGGTQPEWIKPLHSEIDESVLNNNIQGLNIAPSQIEDELKKEIRRIKQIVKDSKGSGNGKTINNVLNMFIRAICDKSIDSMNVEELQEVYFELKKQFLD